MAQYKLSDLFVLQMGKTPARAKDEYWNNGDNDWVSIGDLSSFDKYTEKTKETISDTAVNESGIKIVPKNTVIMSFKLSLGKTCITTQPIYTNEAIMAFIPKLNNTITADFLYYYLSSKDWNRSGNRAVMGTTLNKATLSDIIIDVPQIPVQNDISSKLDKLTDLINKRKQQLQKLDELVKARFVEMFGDFKSNSKGWPVIKFTDIAEIDCNMTTDYEKYAEYPHIGIDSIEKDTGELKGYRTVKKDGVKSGKYIFTSQHLIYSKIRPNLNKVAMPNFDGLCSADAYPILPIREKCNRVFLAYDMRSTYFLEYILQYCNRTNLPKVNRKEVSGFKTPLPPLELQNKFAAFVEQVYKSKSVVKKSLEKFELLKKALMQEYFG